MLAQFALAVGLCAVGGEPTAMVTLHSPPAAVAPQAFGGETYFTGTGRDCHCGTGHGCGPYCWRCHFLFSPCNMPQHMAYWNKDRGYYYFRPYHVNYVAMHQERAVAWGLDPANPYDHRFLDRIHDEWEEEEAIKEKQRNVEPLPRTEGAPEEPLPDAEDVPGETAPDQPADESTEKPQGDGAKKSSRLKKLFTFGFSEP